MLSVHLPFSKSEINRLFVLAFQSDKDFLIKNFSFCDDTKVIYDFYKQIGFQFEFNNLDLKIKKSSLNFNALNIVNVNQAGTAFRFLLSLCALLPYKFKFIGHESLSKRPIISLVRLLEFLGVEFNLLKYPLSLPIEFKGVSSCQCTELKISDELQSSQFITALLLLAPSLPIGFQIILENSMLKSVSYIYMTMNMLEKIGIIWEYHEEKQTFTLVKNSFDIYEYTVSADWTNASYFIALASILKKTIVLPKLTIHSFQPDVDQLILWSELGVKFSSENEIDLLVQATDFKLKNFDWNFSSTPDLFQTFAILTAYERGVYRFYGLETLKHKETHRLLAIKNELSKIGIQVEYEENLGTCTITNFVDVFPNDILFETYNDHRMAMALSDIQSGAAAATGRSEMSSPRPPSSST